MTWEEKAYLFLLFFFYPLIHCFVPDVFPLDLGVGV